MRSLESVTLLCADTRAPDLALRALAKSMEAVAFARAVLLTRADARLALPAGVERIDIAPLASRDAYSDLMLKGLRPFAATPHVLVVQWDGYVVNADAWTDDFLACDYVGAPWSWHPPGRRVGNGGFSLRSRRLLDALADDHVRLAGAEDETIGVAFRPWLEAERGIRFADEALAHRFAFEASYPVGRPFGFHGLFNFGRVMPDAELAALAPRFDDDVARSPQCLSLMRNVEALGRFASLESIAARILRAAPGHEEAAAALARAQDARARGAGIGRNDPCPCGSGKRYKSCHGALGGAVDANALVRDGMQAHRAGDLDRARRAYDAALALDPGHAHARHYAGVLAMQRGDAAAAIPALEGAAAARPDEADFHGNLGLAYAAVDRIDDAIAAQRRALDRAPGHAHAWNNLGLALVEAGRGDEAIAAYDRALALDPAFERARWNRGMARLARGDAGGWDDYEARLAIDELGGRADRPPAPRLDPERLAGRTVLLDAEQGHGDTIQGLRFVPALAERGARVIVRVPGALAGLAASVAGVATVVPPDARPGCDAWSPMMSLPGRFGVAPQGAGSPPPPYLRTDAARSDALKRRVAAIDADLRAGLAWAGNPRHANDRRRSIPLARLAPLLARRGCAWWSLQRVDGEDQIAGVPEARAMHLWDEREDFDGKAALIEALDLVVSVDTSIAHLAGALGKPCLLLLPHVAEWRWGVAGERSAWYPSLRLLRQDAPGDWSSVVRAAEGALSSERTR